MPAPPRAYEAGTAADYIASIEPARKQGAPEGNQNAVKGKGKENKDVNYNFESKPKKKRKNGAADSEYVIARLKRDANDGNTQAAALLGGFEPFGPLFDAHEFIRAYEAGNAADYIASIEPAKPHGGTGANQHTKDESKGINCPSASAEQKRKRKSQNDPERIIARLKRDANDGNTQAAALLGSLEPIG